MNIITPVKAEVADAITEHLKSQTNTSFGWSVKLTATDPQLAALGFEHSNGKWQLSDFGQSNTQDYSALLVGAMTAVNWLREMGYVVDFELTQS